MVEKSEQRALEDWLIANRWPHAYELSVELLESSWLADHDAAIRSSMGSAS